MKLTYPSSHKPEDLRELFEEFKEAHPDIYREWAEIERSEERIASNDLQGPQRVVYDFLKLRVEYEGNPALIEAWMDMRGLIRRDSLFN